MKCNYSLPKPFLKMQAAKYLGIFELLLILEVLVVMFKYKLFILVAVVY